MPEQTELQTQLQQMALALGADFFGVADLAPAEAWIREQGGSMMAQYPRSLVVGVRMPSAIVDQLPNHDDRSVALAYRSHSYDILNDRLDQIASRLASALQREGYLAFPVRASQTANAERLYGLISHKLSAHLAGLGWIGNSCLLVTPEFGPRVRWATVLTSAPLVPGKPMDARCGDCTECVDACPAQAFTGRLFHADEPREARYDAHKCSDYVDRHEGRADLDISICGMCVYICPHGRNHSIR